MEGSVASQCSCRAQASSYYCRVRARVPSPSDPSCRACSDPAGRKHYRPPGHTTTHNSHLAGHSVLWRRGPVAHPVLHPRVAAAHHVALHPGHHPIAGALHHARVAGGPGHPAHVHAGTVGTHRVPHHHPVGSHHLHAATVGHHVGHGLTRPHHVGVLHPHPHHHLLLLTHLTHAGVAGMHLEMLLLRAKY